MSRAFQVRLARRLRPIAINLALASASLGVALLLAEGAVRWVAPQQLILIRPDLWEPADTVGWLHRPNVDIRINTGEGTVSVYTDAEGFRVGSAGPVHADFRVLLLGDSFVEALQVEYEESLGGLLEASLPTLVGAPVAVRNAGVGGWDPDQYVLRARSLLARDRYDLVLTAVYLGNDVIARRRAYLPPREPVARHRFRIPRGLSRTALTSSILMPANDFLEVRSHLFLFFKNRLQSLRMRLGLYPLDFPPQYMKSAAGAPIWEITAGLLEEIGTLAEHHGVPALFVLIPAPFQVDSASLGQYVRGFGLDPSAIDIDLPNRELGTRLADREVRYYDALAAFRAAHEDGQRLYGTVDPHLTREGNELLASLLTPLVAAQLQGDGRETTAGRPRL